MDCPRTWTLARPRHSSTTLLVLLAAVVPSPPNPLLSHRLDVSMLPLQAQSPNPTTARDVASPLTDAPTASERSSGTASIAANRPQSKQKARLEGSGRTERSAVGVVDRVMGGVRGRRTILDHLAP
jgi:hypothetical protein